MPFTDAARNTGLDAIGTAATHLAVLRRSGTELTGGSPAYARKAVSYGAAAAGVKTGPTVAQTFDVPATGADPCYWLAGFTAVTAGTEEFRWPLGNQVVMEAVVQASTDLLTSYAHGYVAGDEIIVYGNGGTPPAGFTQQQGYFVIATGLTADVFALSATVGGAAVNVTADGELFVQKVIPEAFGIQGVLNVAINGITLDAKVL